MRAKSRSGLVIAVIFSSFVLLALLLNKNAADHHSAVNHIVRWFKGGWGGKQIVDDLAEDLHQTAFIKQAQVWSLETMQRFDDKKIKTIPYEAPWDPVLAIETNNVPDFIRNRWKEKPDFEICLSNGLAESVLIDWYSYGILLARTNYNFENSRWAGHYNVLVRPGIYVIWYDVK